MDADDLVPPDAFPGVGNNSFVFLCIIFFAYLHGSMSPSVIAIIQELAAEELCIPGLHRRQNALGFCWSIGKTLSIFPKQVRRHSTFWSHFSCSYSLQEGPRCRRRRFCNFYLSTFSPTTTRSISMYIDWSPSFVILRFLTHWWYS